MVQLNERNQVLKKYAVTEATLSQMKGLGHEEATWRNAHELKMQIKWAKERHAFIQAEIDVIAPPKKRRAPLPGAVPIQSHRAGRGGVSGGKSTYGEKFG